MRNVTHFQDTQWQLAVLGSRDILELSDEELAQVSGTHARDDGDDEDDCDDEHHHRRHHRRHHHHHDHDHDHH